MNANAKIQVVAKALLEIAQAIHDAHNNDSCGACPLFRTDACYNDGSAISDIEKIINNER